MRLLALPLVLLIVAGCDSARDVAPLDDVLIVDLVDGPVLAVRFTTEGAPGCFVPIVYRTRAAAGTLSVEVDGLEVPTGAVCLALTSSTFTVALPTGHMGDLRIQVQHRGETDVYALRFGVGGPSLDPERTSVTRLGPR